MRDWAKERDKIQGAFNIARDLAVKLKEEKAKG
jgi:transcription-repair coupling factor (superfamily II helicase)